MALTRAAAARLAEINSRHPQAIQAFKEGVGSVLHQWTALELAIHHQWGGTDSSAKADALAQEILDLFLSPDKIYKDDVALVLEDYLDIHFQTICEDGSPDEIGDILCTMWRQCIIGDFTLVTNALAKEYVRHEMVSKSEGLTGGDAADDSDNDDNNYESELLLQEALSAHKAASRSNNMGSINENDEQQDMLIDNENIEVAQTIPKVDPDGWETVTKEKKSNKRI